MDCLTCDVTHRNGNESESCFSAECGAYLFMCSHVDTSQQQCPQQGYGCVSLLFTILRQEHIKEIRALEAVQKSNSYTKFLQHRTLNAL
jgi:hypothetical protein